MAEAFLRFGALERGLKIEASSAGTVGGGAINPVVEEAMLESGVSLEGQYPKALTQEMVNVADIIVSMGCGVDVELCPVRFLVAEDWGLDDPAGQTIERVREIRDQVRSLVSELLDRLEIT